jgi:SOS-response transcriptional repressor LexA
MTAELVEYRLADYLARARREDNVVPFEGGIELAVSHTSGKPILRFDRSRSPVLPEGDILVQVDGDDLLFRFKRIAVNVVTERRGGPNVLAERMRRWFGPKAGLPGTRHRAELRWKPGGGWELLPLRAAAGAGTTLARLPFYELKVACGSPAAQFEEAQSRPVDAYVRRAVDPGRHFVVRASGDSMDGGRMPIRDGDVVLCEWVATSSPKAFEGAPVLVSGSSADEVIAAIKIPVEQAGTWVLRSANPAHPDLRIDPGIELRVAARVLEVVEVVDLV